ncbi:MAG: LamG domain-containing protein [Cytophagia bacterium]|nr:LamG domain-containing protein [Cytophagia bacterium]
MKLPHKIITLSMLVGCCILFKACKKDSPAPPEIQITNSTVSLEEGETGGITIRLTNSNFSGIQFIKLKRLAASIATYNTDYTTSIAEVDEIITLNIQEGELNVEFEISTLEDYRTEGDETLTYEIIEVSPGLTLSETLELSFLIEDNPIFNNLEGYYPFDGDFDDLGPNSNNGFLRSSSNPASIEDRFGNQNSAYFFDGIDDYVEIPNITAINFENNNDFSFSLWIKVPSQQSDYDNNNNGILSKWGGSPTTGYPYILSLFNDTYQDQPNSISFWRYNSANCDDAMKVTPEVEVNDNQFHHVVVTKSGSTLSLFLDSELIDQAEDTTDNTQCNTANSDPLLVGTRERKIFFKGVIDEFYIFSRALTNSDIDFLNTRE